MANLAWHFFHVFMTVLVLAQHAEAKTVIISDLDDTVKYSHVGSKFVVYHGLLDTNEFFGMPELLTELRVAKGIDTKIAIVSGSPTFVKYNVDRFLELNKLKVDKVVLAGKTRHKLEEIFKAVAQHSEPSDDLVLIGDDVEHDADYYLKVKERFANRNVRIYIHAATGRPTPDSVQRFSTPIQVAVLEKDLQSAKNLASVLIAKVKRYDDFVSRRILGYHFPSWKPCLSEAEFLVSLGSDSNLEELGRQQMLEYYSKLIAPVCQGR